MMIDLSPYISELLFRHDYVILPGLGGFILHETEGRYYPASHQFTPPSRDVSFNGLLTSDDGLLITYVCEKQGISYGEAKKTVRNYTERLKDGARSAQGTLINRVGRLYYSGEGKLQFRPDREANYLSSAYGLSPVFAQPKTVRRVQRPHERTIKVRIDRGARPPKTKTPRSVKWTLGVSVPIILFLLWGIVFPASFQHYYLNYSGFFSNLFDNETALSETLLIPAIHSTKTAQVETDHQLSLVKGTIIHVSLPNPVLADEVADLDYSEPELLDLSGNSPVRYHVIGGVFREKENAERFIAALSKLGYPASLAGTNHRGFFRVSYGSFNTWAQAATYLKTIKATENPSAWILKY